MPRYEDGKRFWHVTMTGSTVTVTMGKLGQKGRTVVKRLASPGAALSYHDEIVLAKVRAGYAIALRPEPETAPVIDDPDERIDALEARLAEEPGDSEAWMVYGDLLQRRGDPRGELVALQAAAEAERLGRSTPQARVRGPAQVAMLKYFGQHVPTLLGPLAKYVKDTRDPAAPPFVWRKGMIRRAVLASGDGDIATILRELFAHPSGRMVSELALHVEHRAQTLETLDVITGDAPAALVELDLFARADLGDLASTWKRLQRLQRLYVTARSFELGDLRLPALQRARFLGLALSPSCMDSIAVAPWPVLERLELRLGTRHGTESAAFEHVKPLLVRKDMPALTHLKIRGAPFAGAICRSIANSPLAGQLVVLDLSHGSITPADAKALAAAKDQFPNLRELWIPFAGLWGDAAKSLDGVAKHVINDKRAPLDDLEAELGVDDSNHHEPVSE